MHYWCDILSHDRCVKTEEDTRMIDQIQYQLVVTRTPEVLILLELEVTAVSTVFLIGAEKNRPSEVNQYQNLELFLNSTLQFSKSL